MPVENNESVQAEFSQAGLRDGGGDERMTVAVAADPCAQTNFRTSEWVREKTRIKANGFPRLNQPLVESCEGERKDLAEITNNASALGGHIGFFQEDFAGAPESLEHDLDLIAEVVSLSGGELICLSSGEEAVNRTMLLQHGRAFRLGGVSGENRLNADREKSGGNLFG